MTRRQKDPLRPLSHEEVELLEHLSRASQEPAVQDIRAKVLLAVASGIKHLISSCGYAHMATRPMSCLKSSIPRSIPRSIHAKVSRWSSLDPSATEHCFKLACIPVGYRRSILIEIS